MTEYELFYLVGESKDSEMARIKEEIRGIVEGEGGTYEGADKMEKRKLAYAVRREIRGTYIAQRFMIAGKDEREKEVEKGKEDAISRISRKLNLYRDILRFIVVRAESLPALHSEAGDASSKIVAEVVKEAQSQKAAVEKTVKKIVKKAKAEAVEKDKSDEKEISKKEKAAKDVNEDEIDKKLEEVLNI